MTINLKEISKRVKNKFNQMGKRRQAIVIFLIAAVVFSVYYRIVYKQQSSSLSRAKTELAGVNIQLQKLKNQMPDVEKAQEALNISKKNLDLMKSQLAALEAQLPRYGRIPQLLGELVAQGAGYPIDFVSIKPKMTKDKARKEYAELNIEIKFNSAYSDFVNYLNRLESLSQFLEATDIVIEEMKDGLRGQLGVTLSFATLLGEEGPAKEDIKETGLASPLSMERNPFASNLKPEKEKAKEEKLQISGIISGVKEPTVVINDNVYRVGDMIGNKRVKQILPNMVVLTDGRESTVLTMER